MSLTTIVALSSAGYIVGTIIATYIILWKAQIKTFKEWNDLNNSKKFDVCGPALIWFIILPLIIIIASAYGIWFCSKKLFDGLIKGYFWAISPKKKKDINNNLYIANIVPPAPFVRNNGYRNCLGIPSRKYLKSTYPHVNDED